MKQLRTLTLTLRLLPRSMALAPTMTRRLTACLVLTAWLGFTAGCTTTSLPKGGGFKSIIAANVLRVAMADSVSQADLSRAFSIHL